MRVSRAQYSSQRKPGTGTEADSIIAVRWEAIRHAADSVRLLVSAQLQGATKARSEAYTFVRRSDEMRSNAADRRYPAAGREG